MVIDKGSGHILLICLSIEHGFWKRNTCTVSPRVGVTKVVVIDKGSGYIICLSIEHGLGNEGMYCVTEGADAKAGDTDKGSRHNLFLNMFVYRTWILETEYMYYVRGLPLRK